MEFGEALRRTMFEFRLSGVQIAEVSGVNPSQISEFKNGRASLSVPNLEKVLQVLSPEQKAFMLALVGDILCYPSTRSTSVAAESDAGYKAE